MGDGDAGIKKIVDNYGEDILDLCLRFLIAMMMKMMTDSGDVGGKMLILSTSASAPL